MKIRDPVVARRDHRTMWDQSLMKDHRILWDNRIM